MVVLRNYFMRFLLLLVRGLVARDAERVLLLWFVRLRSMKWVLLGLLLDGVAGVEAEEAAQTSIDAALPLCLLLPCPPMMQAARRRAVSFLRWDGVTASARADMRVGGRKKHPAGPGDVRGGHKSRQRRDAAHAQHRNRARDPQDAIAAAVTNKQPPLGNQPAHVPLVHFFSSTSPPSNSTETENESTSIARSVPVRPLP